MRYFGLQISEFGQMATPSRARDTRSATASAVGSELVPRSAVDRRSTPPCPAAGDSKFLSARCYSLGQATFAPFKNVRKLDGRSWVWSLFCFSPGVTVIAGVAG